MYYAAYGSNLHPLRLAERTPSARLVGAACVPGYRLHWHKRGMDGSGKCDIRPADDQVYVAVFDIDAAEGRCLDRIEGVGRGYRRGRLQVPEFGSCITYFAADDCVDDGLLPFGWYRELVLLGCRYHGFPADYRAAIEAVPYRADPDPARRSDNEARVTRILLDVAEMLR